MFFYHFLYKKNICIIKYIEKFFKIYYISFGIDRAKFLQLKTISI